ncbi:MAG: hypothetical protein AABX07_04715 [Nanoarchaeota archaeon]
MINTNNIEEAKKLIAQEKKPIMVMAQNDEFNRKVLEYGKFDVLVSAERGERKKSARQIDSGFNHVLAAIAVKKNIALGIDFNEIMGWNKKEKAERLCRIIQNIKISRKAGVKIVVINAEDKKAVFNILISLGASTAQAKEAISF